MPRKHSSPTCTMTSCSSPTRSKGLCNKHYKALQVYGHPLGKLYAGHGDHIARMRQLIAETFPNRPSLPSPVRIGGVSYTANDRDLDRFCSNVEIQGDGRWIWTGLLNPYGYGAFSIQSTNVSAHRFAYEVLVGRIPDGLDVDHVRHNEAHRRGQCGGGVQCLHRREVDPGGLVPCGRVENIDLGVRQRPHADVCKWGHLLSGDNLHVAYRDGKRRHICRACARRRYHEAAVRSGVAARSKRLMGTARDEMRRAAVERYQAGEGMASIGHSYGRSHQLIRALLVEAGITIRLTGGRDPVGAE